MPARSGASLASRSTSTRPPRILKAPVGVVFSCLTHTSVPRSAASSGQAYVGVTGTCGRTISTARSTSAMSNNGVRHRSPPGRGGRRGARSAGRRAAARRTPRRRCAARSQPEQEAVVVTATLAEPPTIGREREARDDDHVEQRRVEVTWLDAQFAARRRRVRRRRSRGPGTTRTTPTVSGSVGRPSNSITWAGGGHGDGRDDPRPDALGAGGPVVCVGGDGAAHGAHLGPERLLVPHTTKCRTRAYPGSDDRGCEPSESPSERTERLGALAVRLGPVPEGARPLPDRRDDRDRLGRRRPRRVHDRLVHVGVARPAAGRLPADGQQRHVGGDGAGQEVLRQRPARRPGRPVLALRQERRR